jgi:hypothetical protein
LLAKLVLAKIARETAIEAVKQRSFVTGFTMVDALVCVKVLHFSPKSNRSFAFECGKGAA